MVLYSKHLSRIPKESFNSKKVDRIPSFACLIEMIKFFFWHNSLNRWEKSFFNLFPITLIIDYTLSVCRGLWSAFGTTNYICL